MDESARNRLCLHYSPPASTHRMSAQTAAGRRHTPWLALTTSRSWSHTGAMLVEASIMESSSRHTVRMSCEGPDAMDMRENAGQCRSTQVNNGISWCVLCACACPYTENKADPLFISPGRFHQSYPGCRRSSPRKVGLQDLIHSSAQHGGKAEARLAVFIARVLAAALMTAHNPAPVLALYTRDRIDRTDYP